MFFSLLFVSLTFTLEPKINFGLSGDYYREKDTDLTAIR